jgi:hypothetical protein
MGKQIINIGTVANDGTGDTIRNAGDKINDNFTELYDRTDYAVNATTTALSLSTLNSTYPSKATGFEVYALSIIAGALIYRKTDTGWVSIIATIVV